MYLTFALYIPLISSYFSSEYYYLILTAASRDVSSRKLVPLHMQFFPPTLVLALLQCDSVLHKLERILFFTSFLCPLYKLDLLIGAEGLDMVPKATLLC